MSSKKLFIRGVFSNWLGYGVTAVLSFFITPIIVHNLGDERYGIWSLAISFTGYYGLVSLGMRLAITKYVAEFEAKNDKDAINRFVNTSLLIYWVLAVIAFTISCIVSVFFFDVFKTIAYDHTEIHLLVIITGFSVAIELAFGIFQGMLRAYKRFDVSNSIRATVVVLRSISLVLVVYLGYGLIAMSLVGLVVTLLANIVTCTFAFKCCNSLRISPRDFDLSMLKRTFRFNAYMVLINTSRRIVDCSGSIIVGILMGAEYIAYYTIAESLIRYAKRVTKGISGVVVPFASELDAKESWADLRRMALVVSRFAFLIALFFVVILIVMGKYLLTLWIGSSYGEKSYPVLCVLILARLWTMSQGMLSGMLIGMGRHKFIGFLSVFEGIGIVALSTLLGIRYGLIGISIGTLITLCITNGIVIPVYACRTVGLSLKTYTFQACLRPIASAIPCVVTCLILVSYNPPTTYLGLATNVLIAGIIITIFGFLACCDADLRNGITARFMSLISLKEIGCLK